MVSSRLEFRFTSALVRLAPLHALPVPDAAAAAWKRARVRRLIGTINGHPIKRAHMNHADRGSFLLVSRDFIKKAGLGFKSPAALDFRPDPAPDRLDVPEEFQAALEQDDAARTRWETLTRDAGVRCSSTSPAPRRSPPASIAPWNSPRKSAPTPCKATCK